jgi:subtilisin family serine protease
MDALALIQLSRLMDRTSGRPDVRVGLIDGPIALDHPQLERQSIRVLSGKFDSVCSESNSRSCVHGTFVAGILSSKRGSSAPAICPNCTLLVCPIFSGALLESQWVPEATAEDLAAAIIRVVDAGARVINLSVELDQPSRQGDQALTEALDYAAHQGVIAVVAAGNQRALNGSTITRHSCVVPVVAFDGNARPLSDTNLGKSLGQLGLGAPGEGFVSLSPNHQMRALSGTSVASPFVAGAIALLWSEFPNATSAEVKLAILQSSGKQRRTVIPPLLDAWAAFLTMSNSRRRGD